MPAVFGSARASSFLRDLRDGVDSLDIVTIGDSNAGLNEPSGGGQGGWNAGWIAVLSDRLYPVYATALFTTKSTGGGTQGAWFNTYNQYLATGQISGNGSGVTLGALSASGVSAAVALCCPSTTLRPNGRTGLDADYIASGVWNTFSAGVQMSLPSTGDWNEGGTALTYRCVQCRFTTGSGTIRPIVWNVTGGAMVAQAAVTSTNNASVDTQTLEVPFTMPSASAVSAGWAYINTCTGPAAVLYESVYRTRKGYSVQNVEYYGGGSVTLGIAGSISTDISTAGSQFWATYFAAIVSRQVAAGGSGRVLVWLNGGINSPTSYAAWTAGMEAMIDAIAAGWLLAGYSPGELAFVASVTHPTNGATWAAAESIMATIRTQAETWPATAERSGLTYVNLASLYTAAECVTNGYYANAVTEQQHLLALGYSSFLEAATVELLTYPETSPDTPRYVRDAYTALGDPDAVPDPANPLPPVGCSAQNMETGVSWTRKTDGSFNKNYSEAAPQTDVTGNAATVTTADAGGDTTTWPLLGRAQTGNQAPATDAGLTYNAATNALTATTFVGALNGNADTATLAATVTTNANLTGAVTSVGNASSLGSFTSAQLATALTDETGSGAAVFATSPTLVTPLLGTPTSGVLTNCTGTAAGLTAGNVTTNANLTGDVTSVGNAASLGTPAKARIAGYSLVW
jgi:hypothetical protein